MANALLEEETIDAKAVDNLYKYGTTKAPEVEEPKEALEAAGIVVPEVVEAKKTLLQWMLLVKHLLMKSNNEISK